MTMVMVTMVSIIVCESSGLGPRGLGHETMKMTMIMKLVMVMMVMTVQVVVMMVVCRFDHASSAFGSRADA